MRAKRERLDFTKHGIDVAYTERNGDMRIISIRKALKHETRSYLSQISK